MRQLLKLGALLALGLATGVALGLITAKAAEAFLPLGLLLWCASELLANR